MSAMHWGQDSNQESLDRGRDIWFENTFGGEQFFIWLAPTPVELGPRTGRRARSGEFSSDEYRARAAVGDKGYRTMPLAGIWSTSPFTHSNNIGEVAPATATPTDRAVAFRNSMHELMSFRDLYMNVLADPLYTVAEDGTPLLLAPAGTPHHFVYSAEKCVDLYENRGHYFGAELPGWQKDALIYYLQYQ